MTELEEEKKDLKEYQTNDKERRCLEYALHQKELDEVMKVLEQVGSELSDTPNHKGRRGAKIRHP